MFVFMEKIVKMRSENLYIRIPLALLFLLTMIFYFTDLDNRIISIFYSDNEGFFLKKYFFVRFIYGYGAIPGISLAVCGLVIAIVGFFSQQIGRIQKQGLFLALVMIIGPGIIINGVFKPHWGRPRPIETVRFGGEKQFLPVWEKGIDKEDRSFPSGHASVAFYLLTPFFVLQRSRHKKVAIFFLLFGLSYGLLMGLVRMAQGGHFPSDVLWSAGFVYFSAAILAHYMGFSDQEN